MRTRDASFALRRARPELSIRQAHHLVAPLVVAHPRADPAKIIELVGDQGIPAFPAASAWAISKTVVLTALGWAVLVGWLYVMPSHYRFSYLVAVALAVGAGALFGRRSAGWFLATFAPVVTLVVLVVQAQIRPGPRRGGRGRDSGI